MPAAAWLTKINHLSISSDWSVTGRNFYLKRKVLQFRTRVLAFVSRRLFFSPAERGCLKLERCILRENSQPDTVQNHAFRYWEKTLFPMRNSRAPKNGRTLAPDQSTHSTKSFAGGELDFDRRGIRCLVEPTSG